MLNINHVRYQNKRFTLEVNQLSLEPGMVLGIFGANGSGKSTLIKLITKEWELQEGLILFEGQKEYRDIMAYMPSDFMYQDFINVKSILNFYKGVYKRFDQPTCLNYLNRFGIKLSDKPKKLSLGTRQKLMLAMVLSIDAKLIVLDEPTEGIDIFVREDILEILQTYLYEREVTLIIATHELEAYEKLVDYVLYLEDGKPLLYEDMIAFESVSKQFAKDATDLKSFSYFRQKEVTYDQDQKW